MLYQVILALVCYYYDWYLDILDELTTLKYFNAHRLRRKIIEKLIAKATVARFAIELQDFVALLEELLQIRPVYS